MQYIRWSEVNSNRRENARNGGVMKYAQTLFMSLCGLMLCLPAASSAEVETDAQWKYSLTDDGIEILMYRGNDTSVCVPDTIEGTKVYSIGANAFKQKNVASIKIPEGVSSIGRSAFEGCRQLKEVELPNTLETIDRWAFLDCKSLQVIKLPPSIKDPKIDAFKGCDSLREVHICNKTLLNTPPTTSTTDIRKMLGVSSRMVKIVQYDESRFNPVQNKLSESPHSGKQSFSSPQEKTIEFAIFAPDSSFSDDLHFLSGIVISNITVTAGEEITLPTNVIAQAERCLADRFRDGKCGRMYNFEGWAITYVQSTKGEKENDSGRGYGRGGGRYKVRGGGKLTSFKNGATFRLVEDLKLTGTWRPRPSFSVQLFVEREKTEIKVPEGFDVTLPTGVVAQAVQKLSCDRSVDGWRRKFDFVKWVTNEGREEKFFENGATFTPTHDMALRAVLKPHVEYRVRDGRLEEVDMNGCDTFVIPSDVMEIDSDILKGGASWRSLDWRSIKNVEVAPDNKNFFLKNGVLCWKKEGSTDVVAIRLVKDCESIAIPEEVNTIGPSAFEGWTNITSVVIPTGVKDISKAAFKDCSGIRAISLPRKLKSIGEFAFEGCAKVEMVNIPDGVERIGACAFRNCRSMKGVAIPKRVREVNEGTFANCGSLERLTFGEGVTNVALRALQGCEKLTDLAFKSNIEKVLLEGLPDGVHITLPSEVRMFKFNRDSDKIKKFYLTITTQGGQVTREVEYDDLEASWSDTWPEWNWIRRQAELQVRCADKKKALLYPADALCDSHPRLYREFCAGADRLWCVRKIKEMSSDKNKINLLCDDKFGILTSVRVTFPAPGVSLEALLEKYKKQETGRFWVKGPKEGERFETGIIDKAKELFSESNAIVAGDDELFIVLMLSEDHWTENSKVKSIEVVARKLQAVLKERDQKEEETRNQAVQKARKKIETEALDF